MVIDTDNEKLALMDLDTPWEPGLPLSPGTFGQDDKQQLLWGYPGILWEESVGLVEGPGCWAEGDVFLPGFKAGDMHSPSFVQGDSFLPGFKAGQKDC